MKFPFYVRSRPSASESGADSNLSRFVSAPLPQERLRGAGQAVQDVCKGLARAGSEFPRAGGDPQPHIQRGSRGQEGPAGGAHEPQSAQACHQVQSERGQRAAPWRISTAVSHFDKHSQYITDHKWRLFFVTVCPGTSCAREI